uniref:Uncharacterized mitochondrial protein AtMg00810-like n=1 Tax=Tanacetum cinerariifolium TaxID=118510 RepID=A0A6L2LYF0_TANCI|nr:uncharacterized mitochondrial protein AtMg00810-like [Tanacetum cinerariifolium]
MAFTSSSSSSSDNKVDPYSKAYATLQSHYDKLTVDFRKSQIDVFSYKSGLESVEARLVVYQHNENVFEDDIKLLKLDVMLKDNALVELSKKFKTAKKERDELKNTLEKFQTSSKNLMFDCDELNSSELDVSVPTSPMHDRYKSGEGYHAVPPPYTETFMPLKPDLIFHDASNVSETILTVFKVKPSTTKPTKEMSQPNRPSAPIIEYWVSNLEDKFKVLTRSRLVPLNASRPVTFVVPQTNVKHQRLAKHIVSKPHSPIRRPINHRPAPKNSNFHQKVTTVKAKKVNVVKGNWGNPHQALKDKGVIDSGCSRHMSRNISYLSDFEEINRGYIAFGRNLKDDTKCVVLSSGFKLPNENHVLLRVTRKKNMYNVNLKNIVPSGDLTCLFSKATLDESNLWHRRLGHINFKIKNKFVKENQPNHTAGVQGNFDVGKVMKEAESAQQVNAASAPVTVVRLNSTNITNNFNGVGPSNNAVNPNFEIGRKSSFVDPSQYPDDPDMPALEDIIYSDDEEDVGTTAEFSNLETSITISPIPTTRVHKDHPVTQIIGDLSSAPQIRSMTRMVKEQSGLTQINDETFALGHTQEEGIDYEEVFSPVARIEAIWLFLAYASFMCFMVYQMDVKSAFVYGTIEEEVYVYQPLGFEDLDYPDKVNEFRDSYVLPVSSSSTTTTDTTSGETGTKSGRTVTLTVEDMQKKKNDVKARTTLLLSLLDEHQLRFSKYKTARELWAAILKTFGGNKATKKTKKNLLKQQYGNFKAEGLETLDQTFNKLQVIIAKHNSENEDGNTAYVPTASTNVPTSSVSVATISQDTDCAYIASQSSGSQIKFKDINQIDKDDMEKMDIKWNMTLLSMRENKAPRNQDRRRRDNYRQGSKAKEQAPKALMAIDALVQVESRLVEYKEREVKYCEKIKTLKFYNECIEIPKKKLETLKEEKEGVDGKLAGLLKASKDVDNLIESQRSDKIKDGLGYNVVPPHPVQLYLSPKKDLSWTGLLECVNDIVTDYSRPSPTVESTSGDDQNRNSSVFETVASPITPKPFIKFVKPKYSQSKSKTGKTESPKKPPVKYAEQYRKPIKKPNGSSQNNIDDKGYWDSGYSRHMTGNISYLFDYEPFDGGYVSFGQGGCKITGKGTIKTDKLEFENVYFVKDLKYNLFSVSQICDNKNSVLFTDSECIVLGRDFKLLDDANILLKTPRQHNMYSINFNNIVPYRDLTCLVAKASANECTLWHRRIGHLNFKTMNKLVRHNLVRGLPTKCFENDHTCTACLKGKQHKASCKSKLVNSMTKSLYTLHMDLFGPTSDETSGILKKFITEIENLKDLKVKIIRVLVNKSHNKTPYELFNGRSPAIGFLKPFSCYIMILNTLDNLGKFKEKGDEGIKDAVSQKVKKDVSSLRYIALPNWAHDALLEFSSSKPQDHCSTEVPEGSGKPNPTASTSNPPADQIETLIVETLVPTTLVDFLKGVRPIGTKWVLKNKKDEKGIVIRNKARLVAQGYTGEERIDYDEVFAPIMDVKSAFLYGTIDEEVEFEALMHEKFQMSAMGELNFFFGLQVLQKEDGIFLSQDKYVGDILKKFRYSDVRSSNTPMDKENLWGKDGTGKDVDLHLYRSMIGSLMYLTTSRPDIMFAVCAFKRIFRYLKGHPKMGLWYPKESLFDLVAYSDSDYGGATQDRKSTTRGCQFLGRRLISWQCKKHTIVATSTTKAEYVAAASCYGQVLWIQNQLLDYGLSMPCEALSREFLRSILRLIKTMDEGTQILATVYGIHRTVSESSLRRNLKLQDKEGINQDRATIDKSSTLPYDSAPWVTSPVADEGKINRLKEKVKMLEDRERVAATRSRDDAPIKWRSMDEGEAATERISNDSEEMATVLTSMDVAIVLASRVLMFPLAVDPFLLLVLLLKSKFLLAVMSNLGWKVKDFRGMSFKEVEAKFNSVWKQMEDFILMGSKEEAERIKRKGHNLEQECEKKQKTLGEVHKEAMSPKEVPKEKVKEMMLLVPIEEVYVEALQVKHPIIDWKRLVKETLSNRPPTSDKEMELWVELTRLYEPNHEDQLNLHASGEGLPSKEGSSTCDDQLQALNGELLINGE